MADFRLTAQQLALRERVREFVRQEISPRLQEVDADYREGRIAHEIIRAAAGAGILALPVPEAYGGAGGNNLDCAVVLEELAAGDGGIATAIGASWFGQTPILMAARRERREEWLRRCAEPEPYLVCMAMTEPAGGGAIEDPKQAMRTVQTRVRADGDELVITGTKLWPSNFDVASLYTVVATTDAQAGAKGSCLVVVERESLGLSVGPAVHKMGMNADRNGEIIFDMVRVPRDHLLGEVGDGLRLLQRTLAYNRVGAAAISIGMARGALERAVAWLRERSVGTEVLSDHPVVRYLLGDAAVKLDAARLLAWRAAWHNSQPGQHSLYWASMAKVYASDVAMEVTTRAVQLMGSLGYSREVGVEKHMRDAKIVQIYIGPNELVQQEVGEQFVADGGSMFY